MRRLMVYDRFDQPLGDIAEADVFSLVRRTTINGEHALEVTTTRKLGKGQRILMQDGRQIWREYVVDGVDELHGAGRRPVGTYTCVWSIQHDLQGVRVSVMPGVQSPVTAGEALARLLGTTRRWTVGTVTNTSTGGASMYDTDAWSALSTLVKTWGGEVDTTIEVDQAGVVSRKVDLYAQQGDQEARRRYDFGADIKSVRRTMPDGPLYCRMTPRGKGEETEGGGYGRKVTIESVNDGKDYLELASMVPLAKLPDGTGGWEYPTIEVENGDCETPAELLAWARDVVEDTLAPQVGYDVDVLQAAREGIDMHGVSLGDAVQVVDRSFGDDGLRVSARVVEMTVDELEDRDITIKLGHIAQGVTSSLGSLAASISKVRDAVIDINGYYESLSTAGYIDSLISRLNSQINADGGYTYIVPGQGIRTYDREVSDPLIGAEATKVVEMKGGSIRIANTKTAQGEWEWKSVFTSGHIAANMVTAANITAGYIGNSTNGSFWDLDNDVLRIASTSTVGGESVAELLGSTHNTNLVRNGDFLDGSEFWYFASGAAVVDDATFGKCLRITGTSGSYATANGTTNFKHEANHTYTIGFYAKADAECTLNVGIGGYASAETRYLDGVTLGTEWTYLTGTLSTENRSGSLRFDGSPISVNVYIANVMLSEGSYVSEYELSQRDIVYRVEKAGTIASNYLTFDSSNGLDIGYSGTQAKTRINGSGVEIFDNSGVSALSAIVSNNVSTVRVGRASDSGNVEMSSSGYVDVKSGSTILAHFGYGSGTNASGGTSTAPYYTIGTRESNEVGNYSVVEGYNGTAKGFGAHAEGGGCKASGGYAHAEGVNTSASADNSHAEGMKTSASEYAAHAEGRESLASGEISHAEGEETVASARGAHAEGYKTRASGRWSHAGGYGTIANVDCETVIGRYNSLNSSSLFIVGNGSGDSRSNAFRVTEGGTAYVGSTQVTSDRRVKTPLGYIDEDEAVDFVRSLKPSKFEKFGRRELGFYAQDVEETNLGEYLVDESNDHGYEDFKNLSYDGIIAPLVAYCQHLEKRIEELERGA